MFITNHPHLEIKLLEDSNLNDLKIFCEKCNNLGWENNKDFKSIKLDKMIMPHGQYFIGFDHNKKEIWTLAGVHHCPEINKNAWRCLFRGAQLPGYALSNRLTKNLFLTIIHISYFLPIQMDFVKQHISNPIFYISTNNVNNKKFFAKSQHLDRLVMPMMAKQGVFTKTHDDFELFNTRQNVWQVHEDIYWDRRNQVLPADIVITPILSHPQ